MIVNLSVHVRISFKFNHVISLDKLLSLGFGRFCCYNLLITALQSLQNFQDCTILYRNFVSGGPLSYRIFCFVKRKNAT